MIKTFTHDDILRYNYDETSDEEGSDIRRAILLDDELHELHLQTSFTKELLDEVDFSPSDKTIDNILNYSKAYNPDKESE